MGAPHNLVTSVEVHNTPLARMASDHLPIKAHLDLKTAIEHFQQKCETVLRLEMRENK
jgi:hypothetical protein